MNRQRFTYLFVLNFCVLLFLSIYAVETEQIETKKNAACDRACSAFSCGSVDTTSGYAWDLQPVLNLAVVHDLVGDEVEDASHLSIDDVVAPMPALAPIVVAPKQSPPQLA